MTLIAQGSLYGDWISQAWGDLNDIPRWPLTRRLQFLPWGRQMTPPAKFLEQLLISSSRQERRESPLLRTPEAVSLLAFLRPSTLILLTGSFSLAREELDISDPQQSLKQVARTLSGSLSLISPAARARA